MFIVRSGIDVGGKNVGDSYVTDSRKQSQQASARYVINRQAAHGKTAFIQPVKYGYFLKLIFLNASTYLFCLVQVFDRI